MIKRQLRIALLESIASHLSEEGFSLRSGRDSFVRNHQGVTDIFQLVFLDDHEGLRVQPNIALRIDRVETIFHLTSNFDPRFQNDTPTIGTSVGNLIGRDNRACEFVLRVNSDVPKVTLKITKVFRDLALPYFRKYKSIQAIDHELNDEPAKWTPNRIEPWLRCATGIITAKLVDRPNFGYLAEVYSGILSHLDKGFYILRFKTLLKSLDSMKITLES